VWDPKKPFVNGLSLPQNSPVSALSLMTSHRCAPVIFTFFVSRTDFERRKTE
jgi:hypothetical protein